MNDINSIFLQEGIKESEARNFLEDAGLDIEDENILFSKEGLTFVGTIISEKAIIYCYPKYFNRLLQDDEKGKKDIVAHLNLLDRVFRKLNNQKRNIEELFCKFNPVTVAGTTKKIDKFGLSKYIVDDYLQNGFFTIQELQENINGTGRVEWNKTIAKIIPTISGKSVVYPRQIRRKWIEKPDELLSLVHENVLYDCIELQQTLGYFLNVKLRVPPKRIIDYSQFVPAIKEMLNQIYEDKDIYLLRALLTWCQNYQSQYFISACGTTCFQNVWEWVIDYVFGNQRDTNSQNPLYHLFGMDFRGSGEAKPDTIRGYYDQDDNSLLHLDIYDAKYYVPKYIKTGKDSLVGEIKGLPASADISKQLAYQILIRTWGETLNSYSDNKKTICISNSFMIPAFSNERLDVLRNDWKNIPRCDQLTRKIGMVNMGDFPFVANLFRVKPEDYNKAYTTYYTNNRYAVDVVEVNPELLYNEYLKTK